MAQLKFCFVHGFLGKSKDWDPLIGELSKKIPDGFEWITYDVWKDLERLPEGSTMEDWGKMFVSNLGDGPYVMVGYSMGGRLLMHGPWITSPKMKSLITISAKIQIPPSEREARLQRDQAWARRFLHDPWEKVISSWEAQDVFLNDPVRPMRRESEFSRPLLARALTDWSVAHQKLDLQQLLQWNFPVLAISGKADPSQQAQEQYVKSIGGQWKFMDVSGGHSPHFSHAPEVAVVIDTFVR